jgi:hypothetical protein
MPRQVSSFFHFQGVTETDLKMKVPGDDGIRLWALFYTLPNASFH